MKAQALYAALTWVTVSLITLAAKYPTKTGTLLLTSLTMLVNHKPTFSFKEKSSTSVAQT